MVSQVQRVELPQEWNKDTGFHITHFEMVNVLVCLKNWAQEWANKSVTLFVDNMAVVTVCNTGYTKDKFLASCIRNIWMVTAIHDIKLELRHIAGYKNKVADLLSRWNNSEMCNKN